MSSHHLTRQSSCPSVQWTNDQCFPGNIPWVNYQGNDYIFSREKFNNICLDSEGMEYEWGAIEGLNPPIDEPGGGCSNVCVKGHGSFEARGCSSSQRPDPKNLVGFNYDCDEATCYCLYERDTLSSKYKKCFDEMNTSNMGKGLVTRSSVKPKATCYSLYIQPSNPPAPREPDICTREADYDCYKSGRPQCCDENDGKDCPDEMTICDNHAEGVSGWSYCTHGPDYDCYEDGRPRCCRENSMNCPRNMPACDKKPEPKKKSIDDPKRKEGPPPPPPKGPPPSKKNGPSPPGAPKENSSDGKEKDNDEKSTNAIASQRRLIRGLKGQGN